MKKFSVLSLAALALLVLVLAGCSLAADITPPPGYQPPTAAAAVSSGPAFPLVAPDPSRGKPLYTEKCSPCHGDTGKGDGSQAGNLPNPAPAIGSVDLARQSVPSDWYTVITQGRLDRFMPGFSNSLSDSQRWDVLSYVYSLSQNTANLSKGSEVYGAQCASCHGENGDGQGSNTTQQAGAVDFTDSSQAASTSQAEIKSVTENGSGPDMPAFGDKLSQDELWAVSAYVQALGMGRPAGLEAGIPAVSATSAANATSTPAPTAIAQAATGTVQSSTAGTPQPGGTPAPEGTASSAPLIGSVAGQVINASGGEVPAGLVVTLHGFDDMQEALTLETEAGADGKYLFTNVDMPANRVFMTTTDYKNSTFNSDVAHTVSGGEPLSLDLMVYDTGTDTSSLKVDRMHVLFDFAEPGTVQVVELFIISNPTDNVIVAPNPGDPVIKYELPEGASNITFQEGTMGDRYVKTEKGFGDLQAISPGIGQHQILFAYNLPYNKTLDLSIPVPLPVDAGIVMVPEGGVSVTSNELTDAGTRAAETVTLHVYTTSNLTAGSTLDFTLKGRPGAASTGFLDISDHNGLIIGLAALGLLLVGLGVWVYLSRVRSKPAFAGAEVFSGPASKDDADGLMDAIIALDDQFRSGGIAEDAYRQRRAELKQRLAIALGDESKAG